MARLVAQVYVTYDGDDVSRDELLEWLQDATVLDFDSESYGMPEGMDDFACTIDWSSLKEV